MVDTEISRPLLAHLSWWFHPRMEEVAVEALAHILNRYPASRGGLNELLRGVPDLRVSHEILETEARDLQRRRPDMLQKGNDGEERLFIEAKFYAGLTRNQPVPYLERLPEDGVSALLFLAPFGRVGGLWPQLLGRLEAGGLSHSVVRPFCARIDGTGKHLLITHWTTLLDRMGGRLEGSESGLAELRQLRGLVRFAEDKEEKARRPGKRLVEEVTKIGRRSGWLDTKGLRATPRACGYGRYARLGNSYRIGVWMGINKDLWEESDSTPLWLDCRKHWTFPHGHGWNERVESTLKDRMGSSTKQVGEALWIPVNPKGGKGADSYAAALERIVGILDELAEPWQSDAIVLEEVSRPYKKRVMNNVHRSEYVEALVALALKASGWTRMTPWDSWDLEHESGARLEVKQSAAAQAWKSPERQSPARFDIAPRTGYWDDKEECWVPKPGRHADVYVFAWHGADGDTADQRDAGSWEFYVVAEPDLPDQKSIGLNVLQDMTSPCGIDALAAAVDALARP